MSFAEMSFGDSNVVESSPNNLLSKGDLVRVYISEKNGNKISYDEAGKVVLFKNSNRLQVGYARIESIEEKDKYYLAKSKNVLSDFYIDEKEHNNLSIDELEIVLQMHGFTKQYETKIDDVDSYYVFANLKLGAIITVESWSKDGYQSYGDVVLSLPCVNAYELIHSSERLGISRINDIVVSFNLVNTSIDFPIFKILKLSSGTNWRGNSVALWHYGDSEAISDDYEKAYMEIGKRLLKFKDPVYKLFNMSL